ncbi:MAG: hypothetical protein ABIR23_08735 [Novosphingobium sp.]
MTEDQQGGQGGWVSLERGPTQNAAYVIAGTIVLVFFISSVLRAYNGLPFGADLFVFTAKLLGGVAVFTVLSSIYLKSWKIRYNSSEIITEQYATLMKKEVHYKFEEISGISCYFSRSVTMFGLPFDTLIFEFAGKNLILRTSDWKRESLKQFVCDLMSYRNDLPRDPRLLGYIAGEYDDTFRN